MIRAASLTSFLCLTCLVLLQGCSEVRAPGARTAQIPTPLQAEERPDAVNEVPDAIQYLPLGEDVLVPRGAEGEPLPEVFVGPFELRSETLAGALQLILSEFDIPIAFETSEGLNNRITVANLKGDLDAVIEKICGIANVYCAYEDEILSVKDTQTFIVSLPPIQDQGEFSQVVTGLSAILGDVEDDPVIDEITRSLIYTATHRTAARAEAYFKRLRQSTALIIFETYIWEVALDSANSAGIDWNQIEKTIGKFDLGIDIPGAAPPVDGVSPITIGLPTTGDVSFGTTDVVQFISDFGAVKTISQPQLTVLSGSEAVLRVADTQAFLAAITRTLSDDGTQVAVTTQTDTVDTGFTLTIQSSWDKSTVYGNIDILLNDVRDIVTFADNPDAVVQLPETTERELNTFIRVRPGDTVLIAGLVREVDSFDKSGPGFSGPVIPTSRGTTTQNVELVFMIKPRVITFLPPEEYRVRMEQVREETRAQIRKSHNGGVDATIEAPPNVIDYKTGKPVNIGTIPLEALNPSNPGQ